MIYTCGLDNMGRRDGFILHGSHHNQNAEVIHAECNEDGITVEAVVRETALFGQNLVFRRKVFTAINSGSVSIEDTIENAGYTDASYGVLYHINLGYPLLSEHSRVIKGKGGGYSIHTGGEIPRDWAQCRAPEDHKDEDLFCHENAADKDGWAYTALLNEKLEIGCYIKYKTENLPYLMHWRNMCSHDYALGLEPSNCQVLGRDRERRNGTLQVMPAYGKKTYTVEVGVLDGKAEIAAFEAMVNAL